MTTINEFLQLYAKKHYGIQLLTPDKALQFVDLLLSENYKIHGLDGIYVTAQGTRPSMADSILLDKLYETKSSAADIQLNVHHFLESRLHKEGLFFEVVFGE